ncbi:MAG TPA: CrcB family protein [Bryobacteraceae bacterium]|nr:CrcB family protein [Bryobacteraceae bacterium]
MSSAQTHAYLLVAIGGAIGSVLRFHAATLFGARPLTTFTVNITGAFLIGVLAAFTGDARIRLLLGTGLLGGYTTFSAMQLEAFTAARGKGLPLEVFAILFGSAAVGLVACWFGHTLGARLR